jgi:putative oxidoreductase
LTGSFVAPILAANFEQWSDALRSLEGMQPGWGITVVRVMMGIILIKAGWDKIAGGIGGFTGFVGQLGVPAPELLGPFVVFLELIGGILVLVGLGARWLGLLFVVEFLVTTFVVKLPRMGWDPTRIDLMMLAAALMLVLAGSARASVDEVLLKRRSTPAPA